MIPIIPKKLSAHRLAIAKLYRDDDTFRDIYEDYLKSLKALEFWTQSTAGSAASRRSEYRNIVNELEEEWKQILNTDETVKAIK